MVEIPYPNRLAECMARAGTNDPKLAAATGTTKQQIHKLRHGERKLTVEWAKRLAPHLDVSWQELIAGPASPEDQEQADLLAAYRRMNSEQRRALLTMAEGVAPPEQPEGDPPSRPTRRGGTNQNRGDSEWPTARE